MDTSDSECFESADESLQSDDENTTSVIANKVETLELVEVKETESDKKFEETKGATEKETTQIESDVCAKKVEETEQTREVEATETEGKILNKKFEERKQTEVKESKVCAKEKQERKRIEVKEATDTESEVCAKKVEVTQNDKKLVSEATLENEEENLWADDEGWGNLDVEVDSSLHDNTQLPADLKKGKLVSKYVAEEDKWEFDSWEPLNDEKTQQQDNTSTWGAWGTWGVGSILSTATKVSQGLSNVLETGMGVPEPEELARMNRQDQENRLDNETTTLNENNNPSLSFGLGNLVSGVSQITKIAQITRIVESTGTKVINSGLDTLETIGKKTMEVLQDGDPGLKKKRAFLQMNQDKPVLSQILREAKEKAEEENKILEQKHSAKKANYESIFDDCQGLVHLEALEMLSRQCDIKLQTVLETYTGDSLKEVQETMEQVKELCEIPNEDEEDTVSREEIKNRLENAVSEIGINITYEKLLSTWEETESWLSKLNLNVCSERELHQQAIETLAQLTAIAVEQFHKGGELLLIKEHRSTADEADSLVQYVLNVLSLLFPLKPLFCRLTTTLTALIGVVAAKFSDKLNSLTATSQNKEEINSLITNIFLEVCQQKTIAQLLIFLLLGRKQQFLHPRCISTFNSCVTSGSHIKIIYKPLLYKKHCN